MNWLNRFKDRKVIYGAGSVVSVLLVVGILVVAALLANWHQARWDLTRGQTQSLVTRSPRNLLKQVDKPLTMDGLFAGGLRGAGQPSRTCSRDMPIINPKISFNFVDPEREPLKAKEAGYRFAGNVLLTYNGRHQMADRADEEAITNALRHILKTGAQEGLFPHRAWRTGPDQRRDQDGLQVANRALENEGYEVGPLNLVTAPQVPQDAAVVIVASPTKPLLTNEIDALKAFLAQGGRVLVLLEALPGRRPEGLPGGLRHHPG